MGRTTAPLLFLSLAWIGGRMSATAQTTLPAIMPYHAALRQAGRGDIGGALGSLERLIEADPTYAPSYRRYAGLADAAGQGARVDAFLQTMAAGSVYGHFGLAVAAANRGKDAGTVLGHIEAVIRARPDFLPGLLVWNRTLLRLKQIDQGLDYYRVRAQDDVTRFALHHLRAWSSSRSVDDLEQLAAISRTHRHRREFTEAWLLAEYARFTTHHRALEAVRQVSSFAAEAGDDDLGNYAASLGADLLHHSGAVRDAAVLAERVAATSRELGDHAAEVDMLYRLCMARRTLGDLAEARRSCTECVRRAELTTKPASTLSDAWTSLAWIDISAGDMQAGLASLKTAAAWATRSSFPTLPAIRRLDLAEALFQLGQRNEAEAAARQELALFEKSGSQTEVRLNGLLARCLSARGDTAGARVLFAKATDAARQSGNHLLEQQLLTEAGLAALAAGQTVEARESLILALAKAREHEDARSLQALLTGLGRVALRAGDLAGARVRFEEARQTEGGSSWAAVFGLGQVAERSGVPADALRLYLEAIDLSEQSRQSLPDPAWRTALMAERQEVYRRAVAMHSASGSIATAFDLLERSRARSLLDLVAANEPVADADPPPALANALAQAEAGLLTATLAPGVRRDTLERARRAAAEAEAGLAMHRLLQRSDRLATGGKPASLHEVRAALSPEQVLLSYSLAADGGLGFAVTRDGLHSFTVPSLGVLSARIGDARSLLSSPPRRITAARLADLLAGLYRDLVAPAASHIRGKRQWLLSLDGPLHGLPFGALLEAPMPGGDLSRAAFLARRVALLNVPSATAWLRLKTRRQTRGEDKPLALVAFADSRATAVGAGGPVARALAAWQSPLPGARLEVERLSSTYAAAKIFTGAAATEAAAIEWLGRTRVAHFAVHGVANAERPHASALLLADGALLHAYEVQRLDLGGLELAVLSACETGVGRGVSGEGVQALTYSFLLAGASSVTGSLWRVPDTSTSTLMTRFHAGLQRGARPSQALLQAQSTLLQNPSLAHPYFWAAFQILGADEPLWLAAPQ